MKRFWKLLILFLVLLILPFGVFAAATKVKENPYHNSFTASLVDKYERLSTLSGARLILIGGSSLPFGVDSARLEDALGLPVVNFGVYAALGTRVMAEIALSELHAGDVVILAPELDPQTYSDYFNPDILWEASCENTAVLKGLSLSEKEEMACRWFKFELERKRLEGDAVPDGILYARSSFNEYGDIEFPREGNIMPDGFDASQPVTLDGLRNDAFFAFVQDFIRAAEKKGARVWFGFSPVNTAAVRYDSAQAASFESYLREKLPGRVLGSLSDTTYEAELFYNTNYHLNDAGAAVHTETLIRLLKEAGAAPDDPTPPPAFSSAEETTPSASESSSAPAESSTAAETSVDESSSAVPESTAPDEPLPYDPNERFVVIRDIGGSLYVAGLTEEGKTQESLTLPLSFDGRVVLGIAEFALESSALKTLIIPGNYRFFASFIFDCPNLTRIELGLVTPSASSIPMEGLFDGCGGGLKVLVPSESYASYLSDYNWRRYRDFLVTE